MVARPDIGWITSLQLELSCLSGVEWTFLAIQIESLTTALRGGEGITEAQILRIRRIAANWKKLPAHMQDFYKVASTQDPKIGSCLTIILDQERRLTGPLRGLVGKLYRDRYGCDCSYSFSLPTAHRR